MNPALLGGIGGLAALDSLNPATIVAITLILLTVRQRPVLSALAFAAGAMLTVFLLGAVIFTSAATAADALADGLGWLRRIVFLVAAVAIFVAAIRRLRARERKAIALPRWFTAGTALPLGVVMTGADLPNAFPYFIAIERMVAADTALGTGLLILAGYSFIYCLPCLLLLLLGVMHGEKVRRRLSRIYDKLSTGTIPRSIPLALFYFALASAVAAFGIWP